ncbi:MAG: hypothetical protein HC896_14780 [Bacteroidales bacterium]|nr:hypothetical protein [Bacteroidales bacterium]
MHIRYHSWEMIGTGVNGWLNASGDWDAAKINNAMSGAYTFNPEILINIPWPPDSKGWLNTDGTLKTANYGDFANWCADLVNIVNIQQGRNVEYWEISNERDDLYNGAAMHELGVIFNEVAAAIKAVDGSVKVGGPAFARPFAEYITGIGAFMEETKNTLDFVSYHSYHLSGDPSAQTIFDNAGWGWVTDIMRAEWANHSARDIEFHHNEFNIKATGSSFEPMTNEVSMVFDALMIMSSMRSGADVLDAWNESDGWYGKIGNTYSDYARRPSSYLYENLNKNMMDASDIVNSSSNGSSKIVELISKNGSTVQILIANRSEATQTVTFTFNNLTVDGSTSVTINESTLAGALTHPAPR